MAKIEATQNANQTFSCNKTEGFKFGHFFKGLSGKSKTEFKQGYGRKMDESELKSRLVEILDYLSTRGKGLKNTKNTDIDKNSLGSNKGSTNPSQELTQSIEILQKMMKMDDPGKFKEIFDKISQKPEIQNAIAKLGKFSLGKEKFRDFWATVGKGVSYLAAPFFMFSAAKNGVAKLRHQAMQASIHTPLFEIAKELVMAEASTKTETQNQEDELTEKIKTFAKELQDANKAKTEATNTRTIVPEAKLLKAKNAKNRLKEAEKELESTKGRLKDVHKKNVNEGIEHYEGKLNKAKESVQNLEKNKLDAENKLTQAQTKLAEKQKELEKLKAELGIVDDENEQGDDENPADINLQDLQKLISGAKKLAPIESEIKAVQKEIDQAKKELGLIGREMEKQTKKVEEYKGDLTRKKDEASLIEKKAKLLSEIKEAKLEFANSMKELGFGENEVESMLKDETLFDTKLDEKSKLVKENFETKLSKLNEKLDKEIKAIKPNEENKDKMEIAQAKLVAKKANFTMLEKSIAEINHKQLLESKVEIPKTKIEILETHLAPLKAANTQKALERIKLLFSIDPKSAEELLRSDKGKDLIPNQKTFDQFMQDVGNMLHPRFAKSTTDNNMFLISTGRNLLKSYFGKGTEKIPDNAKPLLESIYNNFTLGKTSGQVGNERKSLSIEKSPFAIFDDGPEMLHTLSKHTVFQFKQGESAKQNGIKNIDIFEKTDSNIPEGFVYNEKGQYVSKNKDVHMATSEIPAMTVSDAQKFGLITTEKAQELLNAGHNKINLLCIGFRPTKGTRDTLTDAKNIMNGVPEALEHANSLMGPMLDSIKGLNERNADRKDVLPYVPVCLGHSMGGMFAQALSVKYNCASVSYNPLGLGKGVMEAFTKDKNINPHNHTSISVEGDVVSDKKHSAISRAIGKVNIGQNYRVKILEEERKNFKGIGKIHNDFRKAIGNWKNAKKGKSSAGESEDSY